MPGIYAPADTLISPIITELATILDQQIGGVNRIYNLPPAGPPDDMSVIILLNHGKNSTATIGRLRQTLTFVVMQFMRFNDLSAAYTTAYSYIPSYLQAFEAWGAQRLNNKSIEVNVRDYGVAQRPYAGQPYLILGFTIDVVAEIPTPTT